MKSGINKSPKWFLVSVYSVITLFLVIFFSNCNRNKFSEIESAPKKSPFQVQSEFSGSGNGGGYNGPHLLFELIPSIDPSEKNNLDLLGKKIQKAYSNCSMGDSKRGLLELYPKIFQQFEGIQFTQYCYLNPWASSQLGEVFNELTTKSIDITRSQLNEETFNQLQVAKDWNSEQKHQVYLCTKANIARLQYLVQNSKQLSFIGSVALSNFDPSEDPSSEERSPIGLKANLKIKFYGGNTEIKQNNSTDGTTADSSLTEGQANQNPILRLITTSGFPVIYYSGLFVNERSELIIDTNSYKSRIVPVFPKNFGTQVKLFDTTSNTESEYTFNEFEFMSCLQGELYRSNEDFLSTTSSKILLSNKKNKISTPMCNLIEPWRKSLNQRISLNGTLPSNSDLKTMSQSWEKEFSERWLVSKTIFNKYIESSLSLENADECIADLELKTDFLYTLRSVFYQESVNKIKTSKDLRIQNYLKKLKLFDENGSWSLFDLRGVDRQDVLGESSAGTHRRHQNIFMDFNKINPKNWWVIFIHETLHRLDEKLMEGSFEFSKDENSLRIQNLVKKYNHISDLSVEDQEFVKKWVAWGFQRGLEGEYRAWLKTLIFYKILNSENIISQVDWIEDYIQNTDVFSNDFRCELFADLNQMQKQNFSIPELNTPLLKEFLEYHKNTYHTCEFLKKEKVF